MQENTRQSNSNNAKESQSQNSAHMQKGYSKMTVAF